MHRVFRPAAGRRHLHRHYNFTGPLSETVVNSLLDSCGSELNDKEFRYLRTVIVTADIHGGLDAKLAPHAFTFPHWSQVTPYTSSCDLAESCVFAKQSVDTLICGLLRGTPYS